MVTGETRATGSTTPAGPAPRTPVRRTLTPPATTPRALVPRTLVPRALVPRAPAPRALVPRAVGPRALVPRTLATHVEAARDRLPGRRLETRRALGRRLVITADDLGIDPETNAAIVDLLAAGHASAATLMPVAPAARDAVRQVLARAVPHPRLHVTLTGAREFAPWHPLAGSAVHSLTDDAGAFHVSAARVEREGDPDHVVHEMTAQLGWMHDEGLAPEAVDSHSGTLYGMHGRSFAEEAVRFAARHGLALRVPRRLGTAAVLGPRFRRDHARAVALADASGVPLPEAMVSCWLPGRLVLSYAQLRASVLAQLRHLPAGTSELVVHPAPPGGAGRLVPAEGRKRVWELRLLRDPVLHRELRREGIEVVPSW